MLFDKVKYSSETSDVAQALDMSEVHVRRLAKSGEIPSIQIGRRYRFNLQEVEQAMVKVNGQSAHERDSSSTTPNTEPVGGYSLDDLLKGI